MPWPGFCACGIVSLRLCLWPLWLLEAFPSAFLEDQSQEELLGSSWGIRTGSELLLGLFQVKYSLLGMSCFNRNGERWGEMLLPHRC